MKLNPVAFSLFGLEVRWYGILIAIGAFIAIYVTERMAKKKNYSHGLYSGVATDLSLMIILLGIIGARMYYVIFQWDYYSQHPSEILAIRNGGLAIYGGILAGLLGSYFFCKKKRVNFLSLGDCAVPGLALAQGIGRWGNFINGEAHGGLTNVPWAITVEGQKVHPTFLYESLIDVSIFLYLYLYLSKRQKFEGQIFFLYFILYGLGRFVVEAMRTDSLYWGPFRVSQIVSIILILVATLFYYKKRPR